MATTITTAAGLQDMNLDLSEDYILGNDIDCSGFDPDGNGAGLDLSETELQGLQELLMGIGKH